MSKLAALSIIASLIATGCASVQQNASVISAKSTTIVAKTVKVRPDAQSFATDNIRWNRHGRDQLRAANTAFIARHTR